jgi:hypothetical protein
VSVATLPPLAAAGLVGLAAVVAQLLLDRASPRRAAWFAVASAVAIVMTAGILRALEIDLPWLGLAAAAALGATVRLARAWREALDTLDRIVLRLGVPRDEHTLPTGLAGLPALLAALAPGCTAVSWRAGAEGTAVEVARAGGDGPLPPLAHLPAAPVTGPGWHVEPVGADGLIGGAVGIAGPPDALAAAVELVRRLGGAASGAPGSPALDPRLREAEGAVARALARAERWEAALGASGIVAGVFDAAGGLVGGSDAMARLAPTEPALLAAVSALTGLEGAALGAGVRQALGAQAPFSLPTRTPGREVLVCPLGPVGARQGVLLQAVGSDSRARTSAT